MAAQTIVQELVNNGEATFNEEGEFSLVKD